MAEEIVQIEVTQLQPNPLQPRGAITPESLVDLVDSIREHGILEPLVVAKTPAGFQIIAGERRWRASKLAGLTHVPVIIRETSPKGMLEMALVENVQRVDLNPLDRAKGFERLMNEFNLTTSEIAVRIGKSVAYVSNSLRLLSLPDALKDGLLSGLITEGHARALAAIDDPNLMIEAYKIVLRESGSVRRAEELARRMKAKSQQEVPNTSQHIRIVSEEIDKMQEDLQKVFYVDGDPDLSKKTAVKLIRSQRETKISFTFKGGVEETEERLQRVYKAITS
ncbi:MAG: ParB-like protein partition protein [Microgenomates group bacterium GW2011_GWC1_39_7b]|uniref:ParB-like protein partition protein n=3 Tax=Candidatus Woeseibacteriota TaxID=1752722 RepID=A0A0G0LL15_9BACT|nr:MAG: ParB-like protein partition protein [Candidatus Woesebacteria bacterium GW2011_GWB1_39_10]KKR26888.1 MAG: ParB-like protein partition protein [Microgenomates group bacterium GW2011_GWC1_39_7b]KKR73917.1 MAG: ParB-like protein partition protein [Candidatus Woesebacteria bacterium GW2011_GWA2_40_7]KKS90719.1 MAG: ParB-like protein partition protein [Candidatus Woesebacteria bacterium GW2011_GWA1_43_12]